jgi:uncharacterized protein
MPYLIYAVNHDHESIETRKKEVQEAHRDHLRGAGKKLLASGALLAEDGKTVIGGLSLLDTDDFSIAEKFALEDPYQKAGLRKELKILKWRKRWWEGQFMGEIPHVSSP